MVHGARPTYAFEWWKNRAGLMHVVVGTNVRAELARERSFSPAPCSAVGVFPSLELLTRLWL